MSYLHDRNKDRKRKKLFVGLGFAVFLVLISLLGTFNFLGRVLQNITRPLWIAEQMSYNAVGSVAYVARTKASVFKENDDLKFKNQELSNSMLDYQILKKENDDLKALIGRINPKEEFILGTILVRPNRSPYDTVIIDIGSDKGLTEGQLVFANAEVPLGEVSTVYTHTSLVKLYSSPGEVVDAQIDGTNSSVELNGRGGGNFEMTIPHDMTIVNGTSVVLPNINSRVVAIVADVVSDPRDPMSKVLLKSPINIQEIKWVQVLK